MTRSSPRIPSLDGLRAVSILLVLVSHLAYTNHFVFSSPSILRWLDVGSLGVRVFFTISGYLITRLLLQELDTHGTVYLPRFYLRRALRIFVPYYFYVLVVLLVHSFGWVQLTSQDVFHAFTYTVNYYPDRSWVIGHGWSLSVEEQFYLLWPAILLLAGRRRGLKLALTFFLLVPFFRLFYYFTVPSFVDYELGYRFETSADAIAIGCLLAGSQEWLLQNQRVQTLLHSKILILIPGMVLWLNYLNPDWKRAHLISPSLENFGIALCLLWCLSYPNGRVGRMLNARGLIFLGQMSYSIYLWQQLFTDYRGTSLLSTFPVNVGLIAVTALVSFFLVERPSLKLRGWLEKKIFATLGSVEKIALTGSKSPSRKTES